ncbi:glycolate oxidase subunit GlcE [Piscinibacter sakaiensis]|uniref:glycolate oxidase subunit GlcE n=1 Tax=Piscinibacter sakaiensis TaxID=1547922 RepID=UPI003AAD7458
MTETSTPAIDRIRERIRAAAADKTLLSIRGGATKDFYGQPPQGEPLPTTELNGIVSYEPSELVVTVQAGTPLTELEAALAEKGQHLAFEPPRFGAASTIGGVVAAGLSGPSRASAGGLRDHVLGARLINGRADHLTFGGQVIKNVAGYDVSRVLAGSLGVFGMISEVSLKVLPVAPAEATLVFDCSQADALRMLNQWGGQPLPLNASRWQAVDGNEGRLWLRLRGAVAAVEAACARLGGTRHDAAEAAADWQATRDLKLPWFEGRGDRDLWRLSVPQTAPVLAFDGAPLIEWHGGQRWYLAGERDGSRLRSAAAGAGGHATLFVAANPTTATLGRFDTLSAPLARIHRALINEFDPHAVFHRARLYPAD